MRALILAAVLLMLSGCVLGGPSGGYAFIDTTIEPITDRSNLILISSSGDVENPTQSTYQLLIEAENRMAEPASNVRVQASNVNERIINFSDLNDQPGIELAAYESPQGGQWFEIIEASIPVTEPRKAYSTQIRYHVCAEARTVYVDTICLAPNDPSRSYDTPCEPVAKEVTGGQQAPVAVVGIRQANALDQVSIFIDVVNYGDGLVFEGDSCARISQDDSGSIRLVEANIGNTSIIGSCQTTARMGFSERYQANTGATFTCNVPKESIGVADLDSTVVRDIGIELAYDYHVLADTQPIIIRKV